MIRYANFSSYSCDICLTEDLAGVIYDARIGLKWGKLCKGCFKRFKCRVGVGQGQKYELQENGRWLKTAG